MQFPRGLRYLAVISAVVVPLALVGMFFALSRGSGGPSWFHFAGGGVFSTHAPDLSENAAKVLFSSPQTGHGDLFLYDVDKKETTRLTKSAATDLSPRFRPKHH